MRSIVKWGWAVSWTVKQTDAGARPKSSTTTTTTYSPDSHPYASHCSLLSRTTSPNLQYQAVHNPEYAIVHNAMKYHGQLQVDLLILMLSEVQG